MTRWRGDAGHDRHRRLERCDGRVVCWVGLGTSGHTHSGGYSTNQGASWVPFNNSSPAAYGGRIAGTADNADRLVWLPGAEPTMRTSTDRGTTWAVLGFPITDLSAEFDTDNSPPLAASQVANGSESDDGFEVYDPSIGFHRATSGGALAFSAISNGLPTGDTQGWPSMRFGIATDPVRTGEVVAGVCGVATSDLGAMVRSGLLDRKGTKRGTSYVAAGPLLDVRAQHLAGRQAIDTSGLFEPFDGAAPTAPELPFGRTHGGRRAIDPWMSARRSPP